MKSRVSQFKFNSCGKITLRGLTQEGEGRYQFNCRCEFSTAHL
jgi:hypothetical protein